ncbi:MAG: MFS transporter [Ruthenibacterium sp.]
MYIATLWNKLPLVKNYKLLKGNCKITVQFELIFSTANTLCTFYLSLYMKARGLSNADIGLLVAIGYVAGMTCALFSGEIVNRLGRKRSIYIFEIAAWAVSSFIYVFADNFWLFALAKLVGGLQQISVVAWSFMVMEDAESDERLAAFNLLNVMHTATGIITPIGGIIVAQLGLIRAEQCFFLFAGITFVIEMTLRNRCYVETKTGKMLLEQRRKKGSLFSLRKSFSGIATIVKTPLVLAAVGTVVLYNMTFPLSSRASLYLNVYITDVLGIDATAVSMVGGVMAVVVLLSGLLIIPHINRKVKTLEQVAVALGSGCLIQIPFQLMMIYAPHKNLLFVCMAISVYALGWSGIQTYLDVLMAESTESFPQERSNIYASMNLMISACSMAMASLSGFLYLLEPTLLFWICVVLLSMCIIGLLFVFILSRKSRLLSNII